MDSLIIDLWTFDVGAEAASPEGYAALMTGRVKDSWARGADIALFPEYSWMGLERFVGGGDRLRGVADLFWAGLWPGMRRELSREGKAAVLGSAPCAVGPGVRNRAPIICEGRELHQDKLALTPWEGRLARGEALHLWSFKGATLAVLVCLDIEVPEFAAALRGRGVDGLLVPSATESVMGLERVNRCASARAVELGCGVGVSHLVGRAESELVDENLGGLGWYLPSLGPFAPMERQVAPVAERGGFHCLRTELPLRRLREARANRIETNPARLEPLGASIPVISCRTDPTPNPP